MNFFEHHIGDYAEATAHLSILEDGAYSRLIRKYYATERALPAEIDRVQRLVGARSDEERAAVDAVLHEFFELRADGWHQDRCDEAIAAYQAGEPEREAKKANEATRLKRHRDERSMLFAQLNAAGQHAPWNIPTKDLRELVACIPATRPATAPETLQALQVSGTATPPATAPATPATATQYPVPNPQYPLPNTQPPYSEPIGSGGKPPLTPDEIIFGYGVPLLINAGTPEKQARSFLGGLRKGHGDEALVNALRDCLREKPLQPLEWLAAAMPPAGAPKSKPNALEALEASNQAVAQRFLAREAINAPR
ncbi:YdaU family protein [Variovorax dokdonensis]|uniref:YdaU family protein n=1 Tax=Variovorax dokdonensis TaxID=344883 RepID=A0ABT7N730_9BURK|nr:YdaU family protein [Variovorax dokdonensis]MDM0043751.1 YdaU family protein [Variovorax dokdonensis]